MTVKEKLSALRAEMKKRDISYYLIPSSDFHNSETLGNYFKAREYISGFSGSEGDLLITKQEAFLWVDGRYFIQADLQLQNTEIRKMEIGTNKDPSILEYLNMKVQKNEKIACDGRLITASFGEELFQLVENDRERFLIDEDLVDTIWKHRPILPKSKPWFLQDEVAGKSTIDKLSEFSKVMAKESLDYYITSSLDDIAWLFNMRGSDIEFFPVNLAFFIYSKGIFNLFLNLDEENLSHIVEYFKSISTNIAIHPYNDFYRFTSNLCSTIDSSIGEKLGIEKEEINYKLYRSIGEEVEKVELISPIKLAKAMKNSLELEGSKKAHIKDGIALSRFMMWLEGLSRIEVKKLKEYDISKKLLAFRKLDKDFICESFRTIAGYNDNGAIVHYSPDELDSKNLDKKGLLLLDSGGHYNVGTTDVTRTISLGKPTDKERFYYTQVLRAMLRLANAKFLENTTGMNLDILARGVLWNLNLDYRHGTGHGVGFILGVHESPANIRQKSLLAGKENVDEIREGMIISNEPAIYFENEFGIRIENLMRVVVDTENKYGKFLKFEHLTVVPLDRKLIDISLMNKDEITWLNEYNKKVYENLNPFFDKAERIWLENITKEYKELK